VQCAGTVQSPGKGVRNVKQVSFKPGPEDCYRRCRGDKIRQTVPDTCSSNRESSVTNSKESGAADNDEEELERVADEPRHIPPDKARQ